MTLTQMKSFPGAKLILTGTVIGSFIITPTVSAWSTSQRASAECNQAGIAEIHVNFTNQEASRSMDVVATDEQTGKSTNLGTVKGNETKTGVIVTGNSELHSGNVDFALTWTNDKSQHDMRKAGYRVAICHGPTPTDPPTPTPTATPIPEPTFVPTLTPTPTAEPTDTPSPTPITITVTNNNNPDQENKNDITINNNTQVLGASTVTQLPSTGAESDMLFGLVSLLPTGFGLRKFSKKK